ncbi:hypothetical protein [Fredinandcohnia quinoae]|uniref:Protein involved in gliding motility GldD n=1 Tax=Fredinandcohnia quinoae TaxID=2918902 RepID=A0AAW5DUR9_9BACI|nr:hypothetical protein [Fredinandcohnia sp. SECRCQ15]MCH1624376.1 hypothetical protein [Fredinandcohnia sp. SECRCQ15]
MNKKITSLLFTLILAIVFVAGCSSDEASSKKDKEPKQETKTDEKAEKDAKEKEEPKDEPNKEEEDKEETKGEDVEFLADYFEGITYDVPIYAEESDPGEQSLPIKLYMLDSAIGTNFNVILETLPQPMKIKEYIDIATASTGFEYLSNEYYTANGIEWNESISLNHSDEGTVKLNQRSFIIDNKTYIFTYAALPEHYDSNIQDFIKITDSVLEHKQ